MPASLWLHLRPLTIMLARHSGVITLRPTACLAAIAAILLSGCGTRWTGFGGGAPATFTFANDQLVVTAGDYPCGILVVEKGSTLVADGQLIMKNNGSLKYRENPVITDDAIKAEADSETGYDLFEELKTNKHHEGLTQDHVDDYLAIAKELGMAGSFVVTHGDYRAWAPVVDLRHLDSAKYTVYFLTQVAKSEDCHILYMKVKLIR